MKWRPHLASVLLVTNLVILVLPLAGIVVLRVYESDLIRRTESELIVQGTLVAAAYRDALLRASANAPRWPHTRSMPNGESGRPHPAPLPEGGGVNQSPLSPQERDKVSVGQVDRFSGIPQESGAAEEPLAHIPPRLDLARDSVFPPASAAAEPLVPADDHARVAGASVAPLLLDARRVTLAAIRVTDSRGTVVATTGGELGLSLLPREEVRWALSGAYVSLLRQRVSDAPPPPLESISRAAQVRVFVAMPVLVGDSIAGTVTLSRTPLDVLRALYPHRFILVAAAVVLLVVVVLMSAFTSLTITRPVRALIQQTERVSRGEKEAAATLRRPGTYEVDLLSRAVADMAGTLQRREQYIRAFASNVSHAFKTPLTSMRGAVELLQDHLDEMSPTERQRFLDMLEQDTRRLQRLVRGLLDLAKAEAAPTEDERTELGPTLEEIVRRYRDIGLSVTVRHDSRSASVKIPPVTFDAILSNLLDNARQHGGNGVHVDVETAVVSGLRGERVEVMVSDNGPGLSEASVRRLFEPFFTTAPDEGGSGLGLAITKALAESHGGSVALATAERGTRFRLTLPVYSGAP